MEDIKPNATAEILKIPKVAFHQWFQRQNKLSKFACMFKGHTLQVVG
jgi:hypothetical protein